MGRDNRLGIQTTSWPTIAGLQPCRYSVASLQPCRYSVTSVHCTVGSQADIQLFWVNFEFISGLLGLVPALLPEFKTVFRLHFKQVKREI